MEEQGSGRKKEDEEKERQKRRDADALCLVFNQHHAAEKRTAGVSIISTSTSTSTGIALPQPPTPPLAELERIGRSRDPRRQCGALNFAGGSPEADDGKYRRYSCRDANSRLERSTGHPISPSLSFLSL
ncbi:hypothetical protein V1478_009323 [Vespula squamosa]|uniref:Uncharacterized protein n=1 Tax=Vespula squamosa TaxID=30214 RepID=A0ABD2APL4_VESSQ